MLFLAAIVYAGTISTNVTQAHGTFPQGSRGAVIGTSVSVERRFPSNPPRNAADNLVRAQEQNKEQQDACSRLKLHRLMQTVPAPQPVIRCDTTGPYRL